MKKAALLTHGLLTEVNMLVEFSEAGQSTCRSVTSSPTDRLIHRFELIVYMSGLTQPVQSNLMWDQLGVS
jgi:hypothetical protein